MENHTRQHNKLEIFLIIVSVFVVVDLLFWTVVQFFPGFFSQVYVYRFISLFFGILFCCIPVIAGILIKDQTWKVVLIVLGSLTFLIRIGTFTAEMLKNLF